MSSKDMHASISDGMLASARAAFRMDGIRNTGVILTMVSEATGGMVAKRVPKIHVAIVDDDASVRRAMLNLCKAYELQAKAYASPREFLESVEADPPRCLIVDMQMPDMSGLRLLHQLAGSSAKIPTIVVTANDDPGIRHRFELAGASAFLSKPVSGDALIKTIRALTKAGSKSAARRPAKDKCAP